MSWVDRLKSGLVKTAKSINTHLMSALQSRKLDSETLEEIEALLISTDMGLTAASALVRKLANAKISQADSLEKEIKCFLRDEIAAQLTPFAVQITPSAQPFTILLCGINGHGKTTTAGKLAMQFQNAQKKVMLAACDTFRASAVEQLIVWSSRAKCDITTGQDKQDPSSVAYQAYMAAKKNLSDILIVDTAGRLHSNQNLMSELEKTVRVLKKVDQAAPHEIIMVIDATTGQNALQQVSAFTQVAPLTGLIVTKLDGSAKGGIVLALTEKYRLPIYAIGVGESIEDLNHLNAKDFASAMLGL